MRVQSLVLGLVLATGLAGAACAAPAKAIVITHVTVLPMTIDGAVKPDTSVTIVEGRITAIGGPIPARARRIDGRGKWLIPGLADMHVHLPTDVLLRAPRYPTEPPNLSFPTQDVMTPYIANGVTQLLNMDATAGSIAQRNEIARGDVVGPHIALAAVIDAEKTTGRVAATPADGRQAVRDIKAEGYDFIKVYSGLGQDVFSAIVDEAEKQGMKSLGHIPDSFQGSLEKAFVRNFAMIAHAEELAKHSRSFAESDAVRFAKLTKANGSWVTPTLTVMRWIASQTRSLDELRTTPELRYMHPLLQSKWLTANRYNRNATPELAAYFDEMVQFNRRLVAALKAEAVPIVAGSDTLASGVISGFSLHDELALLVGAGLTPMEALASATRLPAEWLGVDKDRGTIEAGKRADLVLLDADPLAEIANTRRIAGVFVSGRWLARKQLQAMMADLARRNDAMRGRYDWKTITSQK